MKALPESLAYNEVFDVVLTIWSVLEVKEGKKKIGSRCFQYMGILHPSQTLYQPWSHWTSLTPSQASIIFLRWNLSEHRCSNLQLRGLFIYIFLGITYLFCFSYFSGCWKKLTSVFAFKPFEMLGCFLNASSGPGLIRCYCEDLLGFIQTAKVCFIFYLLVYHIHISDYGPRCGDRPQHPSDPT